MSEPFVLAKTSGGDEVVFRPALANRHGLITGATGMGKTVTLQMLTDSFSRIGVPVFLADVKGDLSGLAAAGSATPKLKERLHNGARMDCTARVSDRPDHRCRAGRRVRQERAALRRVRTHDRSRLGVREAHRQGSYAHGCSSKSRVPRLESGVASPQSRVASRESRVRGVGAEAHQSGALGKQLIGAAVVSPAVRAVVETRGCFCQRLGGVRRALRFPVRPYRLARGALRWRPRGCRQERDAFGRVRHRPRDSPRRAGVYPGGTAMSRQSPVTSHQPPVTSHQSSVISHESSVICYQWPGSLATCPDKRLTTRAGD